MYLLLRINYIVYFLQILKKTNTLQSLQYLSPSYCLSFLNRGKHPTVDMYIFLSCMVYDLLLIVEYENSYLYLSSQNLVLSVYIFCQFDAYEMGSYCFNLHFSDQYKYKQFPYSLAFQTPFYVNGPLIFFPPFSYLNVRFFLLIFKNSFNILDTNPADFLSNREFLN